jgi:NodT family efflux transporter outer membrane factor (OMF) lipoprotein
MNTAHRKPFESLPRPLARAALLAVLLAAVLTLSACTAGPDYVRPSVAMPTSFKENAGWKPAEPRDAEPRGRWWEMFGDAALDALAEQVAGANQTLAQAEARYRQAVALAEGARAGNFPSLTGNLSETRSRASGTTSATTVARGVNTSHSLSVGASWEPDLWGRVRRGVEAGEAGLQASAGDLEAARLLAHAQLVQNYFQLRVLDAQKRLLEDTIAGYQKSLQLTQNQYAAGTVAKVDTLQATTQLKSTQAQALDIGVQRAQLEHAIAVLVGKAPSEFAIPAFATTSADASTHAATFTPPAIAPGLPSALLERRPDIAAAERRVAAANAQIGVASAAFFPALTISAATGFQSASLAQWLTAPSQFWSLGPALAMSLFDGGLRRAQTAQAEATWEASVAAYRQTVLVALQEVEDSLATLRILAEEAAVQREALEAARQSVVLTTNQYKAGTVSYLNVVNVQAAALAAERTALDIVARRMLASTALVRALGGGWNAAQLPAASTAPGGAR